jgi:hypothetical protein
LPRPLSRPPLPLRRDTNPQSNYGAELTAQVEATAAAPAASGR